MQSTKKVLTALKKSRGNCSNYAIAKLLDVSQTAVSGWDKKRTVMNDETAVKAANLLGLNVESLLIDLQYERVKDSPTAALWAGISRRFETVAA